MIYQYVINSISTKYRLVVLQMSSNIFNDYRGRIADALIRFTACSDNDEVREDGKMVSMVLTQNEIASIIGCSRQTVNRILNEFLLEDLIGFCNKQIFIKSVEGLAKYIVSTQ